MQPESQIVPALAGAHGETITAADAEPSFVIDVVHALAASWALRSGPFFVSDGQLATIISQVFAEEPPGEMS